MISGINFHFWRRKVDSWLIPFPGRYPRNLRSIQWLLWTKGKVTKMASSGSSGASDPNPLLALEMEVRSLRGNLRRQGRNLKLIDEAG